MLEEIKYYDTNTLVEYVKKEIIPLLELSDVVGKHFSEIDDTMSKYAEEIHVISRKIIELTEEKLGVKFELKSPPEPRDIYETIEYGRRFLEKAFNLTAACNPYTFFVWSIRKITGAYLEAHYPKLFEENKSREVLSILGLEKYWEPLEIKPKKIAEDYTLYAFLDFETNEENTRETIGGLISKLNEKILFDLSVADIKAYHVLYEKPSVLGNYGRIVKKILMDIRWMQSSRINERILCSETRRYLYLGDAVEIDKVYFNIDGMYVNLVSIKKYSYSKYSQRMTVFNFLDDIMPLQMLGVVEIKLNRDKKSGVIKPIMQIQFSWDEVK